MTVTQTVHLSAGQRLGESGQLEVLEVFDKREANSAGKIRSRRCCTVMCHVCKEDPELYGDGTFIMSIYDATAGNMPCGCSPIPKKSKGQWEIVAKRECAKNNLAFNSFGEWKGQRTKLDLSCVVCGNRWTSGTLGGLVTGRGCPECAWEKRRQGRMLPLQRTVEKFMSTGSFKDGTVFSKVGDRGRIWQYTCPICSYDEYVKAGACDGVFISDRTNFAAGKLTCRCAYNHRWSQPERELQINKLCVKDGRAYKFVGWATSDGYVGQSSRLLLSCPEHDVWEASVASFVDQENGCPGCSNGGGYDQSRDGSFYVLYAEGSAPFTGYGVSNYADKRLNEHSRNLKQRGLVLGRTQIFYAGGSVIWKLEREVKRKFPLYSQAISGFKTEATYPELYQDVVDFVEEWLFNNEQPS